MELLTVSDRAYITQLCATLGSDQDDSAHWAERTQEYSNGEETNEDCDLSDVAISERIRV